MGAKKLADTLKISIDGARVYVQKFNETFYVLVNWLRTQQSNALEYGFVASFLGRKRFFKKPSYPVWQEEWDKIDFNRNNAFDENMPGPLKEYHSRCAGIKREGGNHPIQGGNADITKIAMYRLRKWIKQFERDHNNGKYLAHIALQVYDEILVDCPEEFASVIAENMDRIMKEAGKEVILHVPVETGCVVANTWVKG